MFDIIFLVKYKTMQSKHKRSVSWWGNLLADDALRQSYYNSHIVATDNKNIIVFS